VLEQNIIGTLGGQICAYWRAALSYKENGTSSRQYSSQLLTDLTMILDDFAGESSLDVNVVNVTPYLFSYCEEHAEERDYNYSIIIGE